MDNTSQSPLAILFLKWYDIGELWEWGWIQNELKGVEMKINKLIKIKKLVKLAFKKYVEGTK